MPKLLFIYCTTYITSILFLLSCNTVCSQPREGRDKDYYDEYHRVYTEVFARDAKEARRLADSLYQVAEHNGERMQVKFLISNCYRSEGDMASAILAAMEAKEIAEKDGALEMRAGTSGFLANQFIVIGLLEEAKKHLDEADKLQDQLQNTPKYFLNKAALLQERARVALEEEQFEEAIKHLKKAEKLLVQETRNPIGKQVNLTNNNSLMASSYLLAGNIRDADSVLRLAQGNLQQQESFMRPYIYRSLAESALQRQEYDSATHYVQLMMPYAEIPDRQEERRMVYDFLMKYYKAIGNYDQSIHYGRLLQEIIDTRQKKAQEIWGDVLRKLDQQNKGYKNSIAIGWWIFGCTAVLFCLFMFFVWAKRRKERAKYLQLIENLKQMLSPEPSILVNEQTKKDYLELNISPETEDRLKADLESLEKSDFFLDKEVSLASVALQLNTNQRYVSFIVRKYRDMDFNNYIQHCRIHHIINRIKQDPKLLDYKLAYLADIAGFSSHSKFSAVFKSVSGISPSAFIRFTKEEFHKKTA